MRRIGVVSMVVLSLFSARGAARADEPEPAMIQYFEATWNTMRHRMPDVFISGYESTWLPPIQKAESGTFSAGYDLFDRFDIGTPGSPTHYGTESEFRLLVEEFHRAHCRVYVDFIMNHNAFKDQSTTGFAAQGGYPGFALSVPGDPYGDFNTFSNGCPQSHAPNEPCYNLFDGRLVGLIDIAQQKSYPFIRHPVTPGDPNNIPAGTLYNIPNAANVRFYPDLDLPGQNIINPGTTRNPGTFNFTFHPYNLDDPMAGDPVIEDANALLLRSTQYYLEVLKVDGFRLDAAKHIPTWFWDNLWDSVVYQRWVDFDGIVKTPLSFVEAVEGNSAMRNWVRRSINGGGWPPQGASFGNRDALDLNEAGRLRDLVSANGAGTWQDVLSQSIDNEDDGFNNGSLGLHHVNSHDNTISDSENDTVAHAYVLMRTGIPIVYHNALQFGTNQNNFPRANGRDDALGLGGSEITRLVKIHNEYGRGWFIPINSTDTVNPSIADVLAFTRRTPNGPDNVLVGLNDREDNGFDTRNVATNFPAGTRLHELTGNADDAVVDPTNQIPNLLIVGADGRLTHGDAPNGQFLRVPRNRNVNGEFHGRGFVVYGPAVPTGTLSIANAATTIAPPQSVSVPAHRRRLNPVTVVRSPTFDILLQTNHTDPLDPNTDDYAVFRIDQGFSDYNGNAQIDYGPGNTDPSHPSYGFEDFLTENSPRYTGGSGTYRQTIDAAALGDGYHYITVRAYRHRNASDQPLFGEFRLVIYVDLDDPDFTLVSPTNTCNADITSLPVQFVVQSTTPAIDRVFMYVNRHESFDAVGAALGGGAGLAARDFDRFTLTLASLARGNHRLDVVAIEEAPDGVIKTRRQTFTGFQSVVGAGLGAGDMTANGKIDGDDIRVFIQATVGSLNFLFFPTADINCDGVCNHEDVPGFVDLLLNQP